MNTRVVMIDAHIERTAILNSAALVNDFESCYDYMQQWLNKCYDYQNGQYHYTRNSQL